MIKILTCPIDILQILTLEFQRNNFRIVPTLSIHIEIDAITISIKTIVSAILCLLRFETNRLPVASAEAVCAGHAYRTSRMRNIRQMSDRHAYRESEILSKSPLNG